MLKRDASLAQSRRLLHPARGQRDAGPVRARSRGCGGVDQGAGKTV